MREVSATERIDDEAVSQQAAMHRAEMQAAFDARAIRNAGRRKWVAAALGLALLILLLGVVLVANAADVSG